MRAVVAYLLRPPIHGSASLRSKNLRSGDGSKRDLQQTMSADNDNAPLDLIRRKERELAELLKDAENRAKEKLAAARARAVEIRQEAEITGQREAEQFFHDEMTRAQEARAAIDDASTREAEQLTHRGARHLNRAVRTVIDFIFPK